MSENLKDKTDYELWITMFAELYAKLCNREISPEDASAQIELINNEIKIRLINKGMMHYVDKKMKNKNDEKSE